ncbi:thiamine pyrophosphate-dependent enzyme [Microbacterium fluvii]|uniref:2-oxoisovalerate dehydrogenase subunit alpha n=1 Tax=Microbacterium fluvii TaxID=415215 RepID=A0ABW2HEN2_9MICO|nr:thiamine pyrophosphate-dependent enzyme [Microbacterium fluvii]MCU4672588.1 thiamine pyrophosphate-dependent enzyme [Microbacterium fluvii]
MMYPRTDHDLTTGTDELAGVLATDGSRIPHPQLDAWLTDVDVPMLRMLHRDMTIVRRLDAEGIALQRQGQLGLWAPCRGQEAAQVGTAHALRTGDFPFTSYREAGVLFVRGARPDEFIPNWRGEAHSGYDPYRIGVATPQIIIGAQTLHAVGYAMGIQRDGVDDIAVAYFGDGATSQGDANEAMVFAASFEAPVVFVCTNNQWAISEPVGVQSRFPLADRAPGFGIPSLRFDGNDVLASLAAMRWAADHARSGAGPAYLEAVTYRMGPHTTSDDPSRYRDAAEVEHWEARDPIARLEALLRAEGGWDDEFAADEKAAADEFCAGMRAACLAAADRDPLSVFDHVYAEPHAGLDQERADYAGYLAGFAPEEES